MGRRFYVIKLPDGEFVSSPTNTTTNNVQHAATFNPDSVKDLQQANALVLHHGGELKLYERQKDWKLTEVK
jgi:hypothetical protein